MPKKDNRLIIYEKINNLIFYSKNLLQKFPKSERFDLCTDIKNELYNILRKVIIPDENKQNKNKKKNNDTRF